MIRLPAIQFNLESEGMELLEVPEMEMITRALRRGTMMAAEAVRKLWIEIAMEEPHFRGSGAYLQGLRGEGTVKVEKEPTVNGRYFEMVVSVINTAKHAQIIEEGHGAFHLPSKINWNRTDGSIKRSEKTGKPYLSIPLKHRAYVSQATAEKRGYLPSTLKAMMPQQIHKQAKALGFTTRLREGPIHNKKGQFVAADRYGHPADPAQRRLTRDPGRTGFKTTKQGEHYEERRSERTIGRDRSGALTNPEWKTSKWSGLFRTGSTGHSGFMTIRTITPDSKGWNIPAQPGYGFAHKTSTMAARHNIVLSLVKAGVEEVLTGGVG